ncbi:unnamed protein product [Camellia sinensis]
MVYLDMKIEIERGLQWKGRNKRIERLMSRSVSNEESGGPSDHSLGSKLKQPMHSGVIVEDRAEDQSMDLELYWAASKNNVDAFIDVLEQVSVKKEQSLLAIFYEVSPMGNTLLHIAASFGNEETVGLIAYHFPPLIKKRNSDGDTALHVAARAGQELAVSILVQLGKDFVDSPFLCSKNGGKTKRDVDWDDNLLLRVKNEKGNVALHEALMNGHQVVAYYLIAVDPEVLYYLNNEGKSALCLAAEAGYVELVTHILCDTVGIGNTDERIKGKSPIHAAILTTNRGVLDALLKWEPRLIRLVDEEGSTPLHLAAYLGYLEEVQYLLGRESSLAVARDNNGLFPIHLASIKGHVDVVRALLQCWPDSRELLNCHGQNILHVAAKSGGHNMVSYILQTPELEKLINMRDKHGNTPLHLATMDWHPKIVNLLTWDRRMDLKALNNEGMTALDSAEHYMERMPSFRKRLTWTALKAAGAPRAYCRKAINAKKKERLASMQLEQLSIDNYKDRVNTLLLVSTLVATVTFAAGLTMPGGYNNNSDHDQGMATMLKHKWFHMFIFCDTIAMYSSIIVSVSLIWAQLGDLNLVLTAFRLALPLLGIALTMMSLAFVAGVYVVVSVLNWLAHAVLIMGLVFLTILIVLFIPLCIPVSSNYPILRYVFYYPFCLLIFVTRSYTQDDLVEYKSLWWML